VRFINLLTYLLKFVANKRCREPDRVHVYSRVSESIHLGDGECAMYC